jgi:hypothetical protein
MKMEVIQFFKLIYEWLLCIELHLDGDSEPAVRDVAGTKGKII